MDPILVKKFLEVGPISQTWKKTKNKNKTVKSAIFEAENPIEVGSN